jgi:hypothetical protein
MLIFADEVALNSHFTPLTRSYLRPLGLDEDCYHTAVLSIDGASEGVDFLCGMEEGEVL